MLYYFDETADQGYVNKSSSLKEYGLLAGWAFPDRNKSAFEAKVAAVLSQLSSSGCEKLHCTELFKDNANSSLRDGLYQLLLGLEEYVIIHEGAYPLGVKQQENVASEILRSYPARVPDHIKVKKRQDRTRLYTTLLTGVIVKLEECAIREKEQEVYLISDRVDDAMQEEAEELLEYLSSSKHTIVAKAYDLNTKRPLTRTMKTETTSPDISTRIERVKVISYIEDVTPLSFVADFICFELLRHFRRQMKVTRPIKFQSPEGLEGFPLKHKIAFLGTDYFTDRIYRPTEDG
jgi:hypothetical protein